VICVWVDSIHFGVRLEEANQRILVIIGAMTEGKKELVVLTDGFRESEQSLKEVLLDLRNRGLTIRPKLALAPGHWFLESAVASVWRNSRIALIPQPSDSAFSIGVTRIVWALIWMG
jgi:putative transposase